MKATFKGFFLFLGILICSSAFACGGSGGCGGGNNGCGESDDGCSMSNGRPQYAYQSEQGSDCNCADPGWAYNDCISKCDYCEAFGNIGAR